MNLCKGKEIKKWVWNCEDMYVFDFFLHIRKHPGYILAWLSIGSPFKPGKYTGLFLGTIQPFLWQNLQQWNNKDAALESRSDVVSALVRKSVF